MLICMRPHLCCMSQAPIVLLHPLYLCYSVSVLLFLFCIYVRYLFSNKRELFVSPTILNSRVRPRSVTSMQTNQKQAGLLWSVQKPCKAIWLLIVNLLMFLSSNHSPYVTHSTSQPRGQSSILNVS